MSLKCVAVTGGGTAGHVLPAVPVMERLLAQGCAVHFVGSASGLERSLLQGLPVAYHAVQSGKLRRYFSMRNLVDVGRVPVGVVQAWRLLRRIGPQVVFSKGGFAAFPAVLGAWLNRIPVVAHESDLTPGLANRLSMPFAASLCVNFEATAARATRRKGQRTVATGTPLRQELAAGCARRGRRRLGIERAGKPVLLVVGGSSGAASLNAVVRSALGGLLERYVVVHVCGPGQASAEHEATPGYVQREYVREGWGDAIAAADLVVSRAGANALCEWLALGKPHLLVPLPRTASRGDQIENAAFAAGKGWSQVLAEEALCAETLLAELARLADQAAAVRRRLGAFASRDSAGLIVRELERAAGIATANAQARRAPGH